MIIIRNPNIRDYMYTIEEIYESHSITFFFKYQK
jgi:hypothetical protein